MKSEEEALQLGRWLSTDMAEKRRWLTSLEGWNGHAFRLKSVEAFASKGNRIDTGIFELDGGEFVFVPGGKFMLGWDRPHDRDANIVAAIGNELETAGVEEPAEVAPGFKKLN